MPERLRTTKEKLLGLTAATTIGATALTGCGGGNEASSVGSSVSAASIQEQSPTSSSQSPEATSKVPESYPSLATLTKEAKTSPEKFIQEPIQYRLYWASSVEDAVDKSISNHISPDVAAHYQRNSSPSIKDDAQVIMDNMLVFGEARAHGFMSWVDSSDGSSALRNNAAEGDSYGSAIWNLKNPDNLQRFKKARTIINESNAATGAFISTDDLIGTSTKDGNPMKLDGIGTVPTKIIRGTTETGGAFTDTVALVPYHNASGELAHQWVIQSVTNP